MVTPKSTTGRRVIPTIAGVLYAPCLALLPGQARAGRKLARAHELLWAGLGARRRGALRLAWALTKGKVRKGPMVCLHSARDSEGAAAWVELGHPASYHFNSAAVRKAPLPVLAELWAHENSHVLHYIEQPFKDDDETYYEELSADADALRQTGRAHSQFKAWRKRGRK